MNEAFDRDRGTRTSIDFVIMNPHLRFNSFECLHPLCKAPMKIAAWSNIGTLSKKQPYFYASNKPQFHTSQCDYKIIVKSKVLDIWGESSGYVYVKQLSRLDLGLKNFDDNNEVVPSKISPGPSFSRKSVKTNQQKLINQTTKKLSDIVTLYYAKPESRNDPLVLVNLIVGTFDSIFKYPKVNHVYSDHKIFILKINFSKGNPQFYLKDKSIVVANCFNDFSLKKKFEVHFKNSNFDFLQQIKSQFSEKFTSSKSANLTINLFVIGKQDEHIIEAITNDYYFRVFKLNSLNFPMI